jgi:hypothetical protein
MTYSTETYATLRNTKLLWDVPGETDQVGRDFVRCIPSYGAMAPVKGSKEQRDLAKHVVNEISEIGVYLSFHPEYGDYVRVNRDTKTFRLICHMKS